MSDSYARVLREIVGEPVVTGELWDTVTSVGEGDAGAYAEAIAAITRACGVASVDGALRDESTPGAVLDVMVDRFERYSGFFKPIAAHPNITPRVEEYCLSKRRVALNESLAASAGVSAEAVEKLLRSKSRGVIGALLGNSSLSEEQLRRAEWRARSIGTPMWLMARDACKNRAMPVDVVLSWLSDEREELKARAYALKSPVVPRSVLWGWLTKEACCDAESSVAMSIFDECSNADGSMVDYYASGVVAGIVRGDTDFDHEHTLRLALRHPRVWSSTVEKAYTMVDHTLRLLASVMGAPVCPEWVWADALARSGRLLALGNGNYFFVKDERVFDAAWLSDCHARRLLDAGLAYYAVFVACASQGTLTRVADFALAGQTTWRSLLSDVAAHQNTHPVLRRELVPWFPESLWLVARDGFLGRA